MNLELTVVVLTAITTVIAYLIVRFWLNRRE
jgi:hypothetical protein